ncbi:MAG TPA: hypothetical protein VGH74_02685 [Planctomycetaceae bacterium]
MQHLNRRQFLGNSLLAAGTLLALPQAGFSAIYPGVETIASPLITGEERNAQSDIWALEVHYKPMRMILVELTDPQTGKTSRELVWYLAYRTVVRSSSGVKDSDNPEDRPIFVPEFTFVVESRGAPKVYPDRVLRSAEAAINKRERHKYKNSVEIVAPLPKLTPDKSKTLNSLDGVATWVGIDPNVVYFSVYLSGFSNGYKVTAGPNGEEIVTRRTLVQKFWRPGDRFDQHEQEIRLQDEPKWIYR